ncbi:MAG: DNA-3-methyladenine glycosylase 2 family protein [Defluviitaleaceae bacterium]|nr:DNA-3-methyladenine glycosylase 2 family protein [Defluviitaleaceae bacterium]
MDYTSAVQVNNDVILSDIKHFDLGQILDNGQAFRWTATSPTSFTGIAHNRRLNLTLKNATLTLHDTTLQGFETLWKPYFDLTRNYTILRQDLSKDCQNLSRAMVFSPGLRLMKQDPWEILISFILSQNSNIPRIKKMISGLCEKYGTKLPCGGYTFPKAETLAILTQEDLADIKTGYRAAYIIDAARCTAEGRFNPTELSQKTSDEIHSQLLKIHGVGPKVADCVLLFGFARIERFPLDVWMKRVMTTLYPQGFPKTLQPYSGIAQQFLFHYARTSSAFDSETK